MAKTELTRKIEKALFKRLHKEGRKRFAFEVPIKGGIVDCLAYELNFKHNNVPDVVCYEIKISYSDFKSENGHNFYGDENYYVIPRELFEEIKQKAMESKGAYFPNGVGVYVYDKEKDSLHKKITSGKSPLARKDFTIDECLMLMDDVCRLWQNGTHNMYSLWE